MAIVLVPPSPSVRAASAAPAGAITITDVAGRVVTLNGPAQRVILAEGRQIYAIATLEEGDPFQHIVGWTPDLYQNDYDAYLRFVAKYPASADLPVFGSPTAGAFNVESAIALQPDVVVFNLDHLAPAREAGLIETLQKAGIQVVVIDFRFQPLENTVPSLLILGQMLGADARAREVADFYRQQVTQVFSRIDAIKTPAPQVFLNRAPGYFQECCQTFARTNLGVLIERAGGTNIAVGRLPSVQGAIHPEAILSIDPDVMIATGANWTQTPNVGGFVILGYDADRAQAREQLRALTMAPGWSGLKAVRQGRFHVVWHTFYNTVFHFAALQQFAKWFYPEELADLDPEAGLRQFHERFLPIEYKGTFWVSLGD